MKMWNKINNIIATVFGLGYSPIIPGTVGSLLGLAIYFFLVKLNIWINIIIVVFLFLLGVAVSTHAEKIFSKKDSRQIVIDEVVGCLIFLLLVPHTKWCIIIGFIIYRLLDIIKPPPAYTIQRLSGGWGIMIDDLIVGIYTGLLINIFIWMKGFIIQTR